MPCLRDSNSKVNLFALQMLVELTPVLREHFNQIAAFTIAQVTANPSSKNREIYETAASALDALRKLADAGELSAEDSATLTEAYRLQSWLQHVERVAVAGAFRADAAGAGLKAVLARAGGADDFDALEAKLEALKAGAAEIADRLLPVE